MARWLLKTEPSTYSFSQLQEDGRTVWDGVKNTLALANLSKMKKGDAIVVYHTGTEKAVVGLASAASDPYPDPKAKNPKLLVIEITAGKPLPSPIPLASVKANPHLKDFALVRMPRLSVMAVTDEQWRQIQACA